jgi:Subtilase family
MDELNMLRPRRRPNRPRTSLERLESRQLLADIWGAAPRLTRLDTFLANVPDYDGTGQTVAVIDTGIDYTHPNLGAGFGAGKKVIAGYDFFENDADPLDTDGHGTAVAGQIAASRFETGGFTYQGIAPGAKLIALRIAPDTSSVPLSTIEQALQWVIDHNDTYNITAVNLSFGFGRFSTNYSDPTLSDELSQLTQLGIAFVASSGNDGIADGPGIDFPSADATAFSVGSVSTSDVISEFTQRAANLDILAPGEAIRSTGLNGSFVTVSGTSFAAPQLAGTIALLRDIDQSMTLADLRSILRASQPTNYDGDLEIGATTQRNYQRLDINAAGLLALQRQAIDVDQEWRIGASGNENDVVFDREGVLHFAWYDNDDKTMKYAVRSVAGRWSAPSNIDDANPDVGTEFSMKLDSQGRPVIAYLDGPSGDLKLARLLGSTWTVETLDSSGVTGLYPSLAIDGLDRLYIAYFRKTNQDLKMMRFDGSTWSRETVDGDGNVGWSSTLTLDRHERPAIVYGDQINTRVKLARFTTVGSWWIDVVDGNTRGAAYTSITFDGNNLPSVAWYEVEPADLKFAYYSGIEWLVSRVARRGATGLYTNLSVDNLGMPQILFWDKRANSLMRATTQTRTSFQISRVSTNAGKYTMAVRSTLNGKWLYATNTGSRLVLGEL